MYRNLLRFINNKSVTNDGETELIALNTHSKDGVTYYDSGEFKDACFNYIINKYKADDKFTDTENICKVMKALNTIYLDGDWTFTGKIEPYDFRNSAIGMADIYQNIWFEELYNSNVNDFYYFTFIPETFPDKKGGFHTFIICDRNITSEEREEIYKSVKHKMLDQNVETIAQLIGSKPDDISSGYDHLFDINTIKTASPLLPFAQKSKTSRRYELYDTSFDYDSPQTYFIIPVIHGNFQTDNTEERTFSINLNNVRTNHDDETLALYNALMNEYEIEKQNRYEDLGIVGSMVAKFMNSLKYLSPNHIFWNKLAKNNERLKDVITPLIRFIYANYVIEKPGETPDNRDNKFVTTLTKIMIPLLKMTTKNSNENTKRDTFKSCFEHIKNYYEKYSQVKTNYSPEMVKNWRNYCNLSAKDKKNLNCKSSKKDKKNSNDEENLNDEENSNYVDMYKVDKLKRTFQKAFANWIEFITKIILDGMTDEIRPFKCTSDIIEDPRKDVTFDDVLPEQASVNTSASLDDSFYIKTLRSWCAMFIFVEFYNTNTIQKTIHLILTAFTRYYIWYDNKNVTGKSKLYIYNIKQTKPLCRYPYNQWLLDTENGECFKEWIKGLYLHIIEHEMLTIHRDVNIFPFFKNLERAQLIDNNLYKKMIQPLTNFDQDIERMYRNILSSYTSERWDPPKELDPVAAPFFPMRNGLLEFLENGEVKMHYNNHSRFMTVYTNVLWSDNYNYNCEEYKAVETMWKQIFPIEEERKYNLQLFASSLTGSILKDMLIIPYGTGGDGKTISNNAMLGMLGSDGLTSHMKIEENGKREYIENPCGLATTMKTETILTSAKSGHDSGGTIQLKNKRFCTVQEPDPNVSGGKLNCSRIKEILSGTAITAREIHIKAEAFIPNVVITLQTNILLAYTEDTDAIRRRITVVPYRSKFTTAINEDKFDTLEYKFNANPQLSDNLINNPKYWQALFYVLLPYTKDLVKNGIKALSSIHRPSTIVDATNKSFAQSNGLVGWLNNNIEECSGSVIQITKLAQEIIQANKSSRDNKEGSILSSSNKLRDMQIEIYSQLIGTFMGRIYKLKREFYNRRQTDLIPGFNLETSENDTNSSVIEKYFENYAVNNIENFGLPTKKDLFIVGYKLKGNDEMDIDY